MSLTFCLLTTIMIHPCSECLSRYVCIYLILLLGSVLLLGIIQHRGVQPFFWRATECAGFCFSPALTPNSSQLLIRALHDQLIASDLVESSRDGMEACTMHTQQLSRMAVLLEVKGQICLSLYICLTCYKAVILSEGFLRLISEVIYRSIVTAIIQ